MVAQADRLALDEEHLCGARRRKPGAQLSYSAEQGRPAGRDRVSTIERLTRLTW